MMQDVMQELQEIRALAREFAQSELRPHVEKWDHDRTFGSDVIAQVAELGFFGMTASEAFGGMAFDLVTYAAALEEIAWGEPSIALVIAQHAQAAILLEQNASDELKSQWLESITSGEAQPCFAMAEEHAGSDLAQARTKAEKQGDQWQIRGSKAWVTHANAARLVFVLASVDDQNLALFAVPVSDGVKIGPRANTLGLRPVEIGALEIDAKVPDSARVLGPLPIEGLLDAWKNIARVSIAAISLGIAQAALDHALRYANEREQFKTRLREFEGIQYKLADMAIRIEASRSLLERAARSGSAQLITMAKVFASKSAMWVTTEAVQIFGGYGYMRDYPVEKLMRDAKAMEMLEGANELLRVEIAQALYD